MNPNMDFNPKVTAQDDPLQVPENTIPWGNESSFSNENTRSQYIKNDTEFYFGKDSSGNFIDTIPIEVNMNTMARGQERYNIYCTPCHGMDGSGNGIVPTRGWFKPAKYWEQRILDYPDGKLYDIVKNGINSMPGYWNQIKEEDRWAIVAYVRALQVAHTTQYSSLPDDIKKTIN